MPMEQRGAMPAQVDKVMGHLFQVFRLRFGHPKGRQAMNEEEAGDFCLALQAVISAKELIALYEKHENHAFKQFVMTRLNNGPDSGGYIIQALREAWAADDYHAALAALRMAYQFLNAVEPDFNTAGPDGYHSPELHRYAHLYSYQDTAEKPRYQILDGQAAPGLLNREYVEPEAERKPPPTLEDMFLLTEEDMCDDGCSTERGSDDDGTEKGFDTDEEEALDSIFEAVSLDGGSSAAQGCDAGVELIAQTSQRGDETDLESVVIVGEHSDLGDISDFESISDADGASESDSCRPLLPAVQRTRDESASHIESVESPTHPTTGAPLTAAPDTANIDTGWESESLVGLSSDDDYEQVVVEDWEIETEDLSSNMVRCLPKVRQSKADWQSGLSLTSPRP